MRWFALVLVGCGTAMPVVDAGEPDAGADAGFDAGAERVTLRYVAAPAGACGSALDCAMSTVDDGGLARWRARYVDAGCVVGLSVGDAGPETLIDCRRLCRFDGGHQLGSSDCCAYGGWTPYASHERCAWTPP